MAQYETLLDSIISDAVNFDSVIIPRLKLAFNDKRQRIANEVPGFIYSEDGKKTGKGHIVTSIGDSGFEMQLDGEFPEQYSYSLKILHNIVSTDRAFWFKPPVQSLTMTRFSRVNPDVFTTKGFYVKAIKHDFNFDTINFASSPFKLTLVEVKKNFEPSTLFSKIDEMLAKIINFIYLAGDYVELFEQNILSIVNIYEQILGSLKEIANIGTTAIDSITNTINRVKNFPTDMENIANSFKAINGSILNLGKSLTGQTTSGVNAQKSNQNAVYSMYKSLATYNSTIAPKPNYTSTNIIYIKNIQENITKGYITSYLNQLGFIALLDMARAMNYTSKDELFSVKKDLQELKDFILNDTRFSGIPQGTKPIDETLSRTAFNIELAGNIANLYSETMAELKTIEESLFLNKTITTLSDTVVNQIIFKYYYYKMSLGSSYEAILDNFLSANPNYLTGFSIVKAGNVLNLPV